MNIRILRSGSKVQDSGDSENHHDLQDPNSIIYHILYVYRFPTYLMPYPLYNLLYTVLGSLRLCGSLHKLGSPIFGCLHEGSEYLGSIFGALIFANSHVVSWRPDNCMNSA